MSLNKPFNGATLCGMKNSRVYQWKKSSKKIFCNFLMSLYQILEKAACSAKDL
jgi:hypothetical protein